MMPLALEDCHLKVLWGLHSPHGTHVISCAKAGFQTKPIPAASLDGSGQRMPAWRALANLLLRSAPDWPAAQQTQSCYAAGVHPSLRCGLNSLLA